MTDHTRLTARVVWPNGTSVLLLCCSVLSCAPPPALITTAEPVEVHRAFAASSEEFKGGLRGSLHGRLQLENDLLTVVVERGYVFSYTRLSGTSLSIGIDACPSFKKWRSTQRLRSEPKNLGPTLAGERRELEDSVVLTLQLPPGLDGKLHELRFDLRGELNSGTSGSHINEDLALDGSALPPDCERGRDLWGRGELRDSATQFIPPIPPFRQ